MSKLSYSVLQPPVWFSKISHLHGSLYRYRMEKWKKTSSWWAPSLFNWYPLLSQSHSFVNYSYKKLLGSEFSSPGGRPRSYVLSWHNTVDSFMVVLFNLFSLFFPVNNSLCYPGAAGGFLCSLCWFRGSCLFPCCLLVLKSAYPFSDLV